MKKINKLMLIGLLTIAGFAFGSIISIIPAAIITRATVPRMAFDPFPPLMAFGCSMVILALFLAAAYEGMLKMSYICVVVVPCLAWAVWLIVPNNIFTPYRYNGLVFEFALTTIIFVCVSLIVRRAGWITDQAVD